MKKNSDTNISAEKNTVMTKNKGRITLLLVLATALAPIILAIIFYFYYSKHPSMQTRNYGQLVQPMRKMPKDLYFQEQTQTQYDYIDGDWKASTYLENKPIIEKARKLSDFSGKWLMVYYQAGNLCDEVCVKHLYVLRQLRLSLGKEGGRFIPIWLKGNAKLTPELQKLYDNPHSNLRLLKINPLSIKNPLDSSGSENPSNSSKSETPLTDIKALENWLSHHSNHSVNFKIAQNIQSGLYLIDPEMNYMMRYPNIQEPLKIIKDLQLLLKWSRIG